MKYSDKLNGYWEEGYHYYLEFRNERLTVRGYDRGIRLETTVTYDADSIEQGKRTAIALEDNILSRDYQGHMMTEIKELAYENGELKMLYYYTIMGETLYTLTKKENGPFDHIIIRDDEFLQSLQGSWEQWTPDGKPGSPMIIKENNISWFGCESKFHVVSYKYDTESVYIVPEDLTRGDFGGFTNVRVYPDKLTAWMIVCDMDMPLSVFARKDMLDRIEIPSAARLPARCSMRCPPTPFSPAETGFIGMTVKETPKSANLRFCPECGSAVEKDTNKFCSMCGYKLDLNK